MDKPRFLAIRPLAPAIFSELLGNGSHFIDGEPLHGEIFHEVPRTFIRKDLSATDPEKVKDPVRRSTLAHKLRTIP